MGEAGSSAATFDNVTHGFDEVACPPLNMVRGAGMFLTSELDCAGLDSCRCALTSSACDHTGPSPAPCVRLFQRDSRPPTRKPFT